MIFSLIDNKNSCIGVYANKNIYPSLPKSKLSQTWSYSPWLFSTNHISYARIFTKGKTLNNVCPEKLKNDWDRVKQEKRKFLQTFKTAKVDLLHNCFYDLVPDFFLHDYFGIKNEITEHVFQTYEKPKNHDFLVDVWKLTEDIKQTKIKHKINQEKRFSSHTISYNIFGTITGRLSTEKGSFPILQLPQDKRKFIKPRNDFFLKLDFNGAELRTALALAGQQQPQEDVIKRLQKQLNIETREETKKKFYSWLYNPYKYIPEFEELFSRENILTEFYKNDKVINTFGREIECDDYHAISYLNQSETNDTFLEKVIELFYALHQKFETKIAWLVHDELVLDVRKSEIKKIKTLIENFANTRHGHYLLNVNVGKNYGEMVEWKIM